MATVWLTRVQVLAEFIEAREAPLLPSEDVAETVCLITCNAYISLCYRDAEPWPPEKVFKKFEACGLLAQYIRCSTIPQDGDAIAFPVAVSKFYEDLNSSQVFVKKRFSPSEPCGKVVADILSGSDGSRVKRPEVINRLKAIAAYTSMMHSEVAQNNTAICRNCNNYDLSQSQKSMMRCARCESVSYCSKVRRVQNVSFCTTFSTLNGGQHFSAFVRNAKRLTGRYVTR